jgi:hypothetical protein
LADVVKFVLELTDKVTPAGKKVQQTLTSLRGGTSKFAASTKSAGVGAKALTSGAMSMAKGVIAANAAMKAFNLGVAGAGMIADGVAFQQSSRRALETMLGSKDAADKAYGKILSMSSFLRTGAKETVAGVQDIMSAGFKFEAAMKIFQGASDLKRFKPDMEIGSIVKNFGQIKALGRATFDELKEIGIGSGLGMEGIVKQLAALRKTDTKTVMSDLSKGMIGADQAITAVLKAITAKTGKALGGFTKESSKDFGTIMESFKNLPEAYTLRMKTDNNGFMKFLDQILTVLDPESPTGQKILGYLDTLGTKFSKMFEDVSIDDVIYVFDTIGTVVGGVVDALSAFWTNAKSGFEAMTKNMGKFGGTSITLTGVMKGLGKVMGFLGTMAGYTIGTLVLVADGVAQFFMSVAKAFDPKEWEKMWFKLTDWWDGVGEWFDGLVDKALDWGTNIVDGLWNGIKNTWKGFIEKVKGLVNLLPDVVKKTLGIASPSKVFMDLGKHTMSGFEKGVNDNAGGVQAAVNTAVAAPSMGAMAASRTANVSPNIAVTVNVYAKTNAPAGDIADEAATRFENVLSSVVERLAREFGTAA